MSEETSLPVPADENAMTSAQDAEQREAERRAGVVSGLRQLADQFDSGALPVPVRHIPIGISWHVGKGDEDGIPAIQATSTALGQPVTRRAGESHVHWGVETKLADNLIKVRVVYVQSGAAAVERETDRLRAEVARLTAERDHFAAQVQQRGEVPESSDGEADR